MTIIIILCVGFYCFVGGVIVATYLHLQVLEEADTAWREASRLRQDARLWADYAERIPSAVKMSGGHWN